jgi:ribosomal RNA-processing protein 12
MNPSFSVIIIGDFCTYFYLFRPSKWNDTKIFSDFGDDESEGSDAEYMDARTMSGRRSKGSSQLKSKASLLRLVC